MHISESASLSQTIDIDTTSPSPSSPSKGRKRGDPRKREITDPNCVVQCIWCSHPFTPAPNCRQARKNQYCSARCRMDKYEEQNPRVSRADFDLLQKIKLLSKEKLQKLLLSIC